MSCASRQSVRRLVWCTLLVVSAGAPVLAQPVEWPVTEGGNGHFYELVDAPGIDWLAARDAAAASVFGGVNGHLLVITSEPEQQFIADQFSPGNEAGERWLGGYQDTSAPDYAEPTGGWRWITGEEWDFTNWHAGEPNNSGGDADFLKTWGTGPAEWLDFRLDGGDVRGYFIEYPAPPCPADLAPPLGSLDFTDVIFFLGAFTAELPEADFAPPIGQWDFSDVVAFLTAFGAGCP